MAAAARTKSAFDAADAPPDRVALVRSWVHLLGGRIDLQRNGIQLSKAEIQLLGRFGLSMADAGRAVRIVEEEDPEGLAGLSDALKFDNRTRQEYEPASPDGVLLRLAAHESYRTAAQKAAIRALLTQPPGSGLMVSMPTGFVRQNGLDAGRAVS